MVLVKMGSVQRRKYLRSWLYITLVCRSTRLNNGGKQSSENSREVGAAAIPKARGEEMAYGQPPNRETAWRVYACYRQSVGDSGAPANQRFDVGRSEGKGSTTIAIQNADSRVKAKNQANDKVRRRHCVEHDPADLYSCRVSSRV